MSRANKAVQATVIAVVATAAVIGLALAQVPPRPATPGDPHKTIPEKMLPPSEGIPAPRGQNSPVAPVPGPGRQESLSQKLDRTDGVLTPPAGVLPPMTVPAPAPKIDQDMVIPPPPPQYAPAQPK